MNNNRQIKNRGKKSSHYEKPRADFGLEEGVETPVSKMIGSEHNSSLNGLIKGTQRHMTAENFKKMLSALTQRKLTQHVGTGVCVFLAFAHLICSVVLTGIYYENAANTFGTSPLAFTAFIPAAVMIAVFCLAGISFWSTEPDVIIGAGIGAFIVYVFFFVMGILVLRITTPIDWSSCPSMDPPGTAIYKQMVLYKGGNFTFYPLDYFNPDSILNPSVTPPYYTIDDWRTVVGYTVKEVICKNNILYQFFWWLNMAMYWIGGIILGGLVIDAYNRRKEAARAWEYIQKKLPMFQGVDDKQYVTLNESPIQQMPMDYEEESQVTMYPNQTGGNQNYI